MPSNKIFCVLPTCQVRKQNGWRGRRIESNQWKLKVSTAVYPTLRDHVGLDFDYSENDFICSSCDIDVRNHSRVQVEGIFTHVKRPKRSDLQCQDLSHSAPNLSEDIVLQVDDNSGAYATSEPEQLFEDPHSVQISEPEAGISLACGSCVTVSSMQSNEESQVSDACTETSYTTRHASRKDTVLIPGVHSLVATERKCCVCGGKGRCRIPLNAVLNAWMTKFIHIPPSNRCCKEHLKDGKLLPNILNVLKPQKRNTEMSGDQLSKWMHGAASYFSKHQRTLDFDGVRYDDTVYDMLLGVNRANFEIMYAEVGKDSMRNSKNRTTKSALAMFLMKLRLNVSQRVIAFLFDCKHQSTVSEAIDAVLQCLEASFVPKHLGYKHKSRNDFMGKHMKEFFTKVLGLAPNQMILLLDGTYLYVEKSSIYRIQRKMFSQHKYRNLVKPMMIVCPDGQIMEVEGLYFADGGNNDAKILEHMLKKDGSITEVLEPGDALLLDRGFRDIKKELENRGYHVFMPSCIQKRKKSDTESNKQFTTEEANKSRQVTLLRRIVEQANGRIKNKFPFFEHTIRASYFKKIGRLFRVAAAIINAFSPPLFTDKPFTDKVAEIVSNHVDRENDLMNKVIAGKWKTKRVIFEDANEDSCLGFPSMTEDELMEFTLGSYQLAMGMRYNEQHFINTASYSFKMHKEHQNIIRVKMQSRFRKSTIHNVWIEFEEFVNGKEGITGWYCECQTGTRTLGFCSHVAGVVRYLSMDRFEQMKHKDDVSNYFLDAAEALATFEDECSDDESSDDEDERSGGEEEEEELLDV